MISPLLKNKEKIEKINKVLDGVANPLKYVVCSSSKLNFAKRKAENAGTSNAINDKAEIFKVSFSKIKSVDRLLNIEKSINPGTIPKDIQSANESNSPPIGLLCFNKRATIPSKKSATKEIIIKIITIVTVCVVTFPLLEEIKTHDSTPQDKLSNVK